ncbi:MAG TPA: YXWGXW repeat-containing protein [Polyangiaceae bacterium]|nr:YXWGXW repeat-containing protein [Polyangiaceae bacterium]
MVRNTAFRFAPAALAVACGGGVALAPSGPHPINAQEFVEVEFPPPPAQIEEIPERLPEQDECTWVDGHYHWRGRWVWIPGRWVVPPEDCYYAPALVEWSKTRDPKLYYSPPRWYREGAELLPANRAICPIPRACSGTASAGVGQQ